MTDTKIILAESSDIMLNGIADMLRGVHSVEITGQALRYNQLCSLIEQVPHDMVVLGPMITERFGHQLMGYLVNRFPEVKIVQVNLDDDKDIILKKIERVTLNQEV